MQKHTGKSICKFLDSVINVPNIQGTLATGFFFLNEKQKPKTQPNGNRIKGRSIEEEMQMANKHLKRSPDSLLAWELKQHSIFHQ